MTPLETTLNNLLEYGYESRRLGTLTNVFSQTEAYHVYAIGRVNRSAGDVQTVIVREGKDGTYQFYAPVIGNSSEQATTLASWLDKHLEPDWDDEK